MVNHPVVTAPLESAIMRDLAHSWAPPLALRDTVHGDRVQHWISGMKTLEQKNAEELPQSDQ